MVNLLDFTGKKILITGGAKGIGKEAAVMLSKLGARIILLDILENELQEAIKCLEGDKNCYYVYNLSDLENIESLTNKIVSDCGALDSFLHCVGVRCRRPISMITPSILQSVMTVNFGSFMELTRCISKKKNFNEGLSIVGISSISAQRGNKSVTAYAASKAAMDAAVRCLAKELAPKGIRLNTVVPSQINTHVYSEFIKASGGESDTDRNYLSRQYLGLGEPMDVANVIAFLLSDCSKFITGAAIPVDGGFLSS